MRCATVNAHSLAMMHSAGWVIVIQIKNARE